MGANARVPFVPSCLVSKQLLILGGGFGLYGYLPAAIEANWRVSTLERYENFINNRIELVDFVNQITFLREESLDLNSFGGIVVARNPTEQFKFVLESSNYNGHYFLEKPIGNTKETSLELLNILHARASSFSIAYLFRYQDWYKEVFSAARDNYNMLINWKIPHTKKNSWKNDPTLGGGVLSYYGIHLLALIAELRIEPENLQLFYKSDILRIESNKSSKLLQIELSTSSTPAFEISLSSPGGSFHWSGASPFGPIPIAGIPDPRIPGLTQYLSESRERKDSIKILILERRIQELRDTISRFL